MLRSVIRRTSQRATATQRQKSPPKEFNPICIRFRVDEVIPFHFVIELDLVCPLYESYGTFYHA